MRTCQWLFRLREAGLFGLLDERGGEKGRQGEGAQVWPFVRSLHRRLF